MLSAFSFLTAPFRDNPGPKHWMTVWEAAFAQITRVVQDEWVSPVYSDWSKRLTRYVEAAQQPVVLIAHSLGASLTMHRAQEAGTSIVAGAFLDAPSDCGLADIWPEAQRNGFVPMNLRPLPFTTTIIAARNDPYVCYDRAARFLAGWCASPSRS